MTGPSCQALQGKRLVLGVTGSIAAYKAVDLLRRLTEQGAVVTVVMTAAATRFVTPLTFQALSRRRVYTDLFNDVEGTMPHLALTEEADLLLIAPATADFIARAAAGLADDLLSAVFLATRRPVILAPAMDEGMWQSAVMQRNLTTLKGLGVHMVEPETGWLASGAVGPGRLADGDRILAAVADCLAPPSPGTLDQEMVLVTAGPTWEALDPIRGFSSRSSGRMGYAIAEAARRRGARVVLISGATALPPPPGPGIETVRVVTVEEMRQAVARYLSTATIVIMAAAPSDYRPASPAAQKLKKGRGRLTLDLEETPDILQEVGSKKGGRLLVGFALETERPLEFARRKLEEKRLDLIVVNGVGSVAGQMVEATFLGADGTLEPLPAMAKEALAERLLDRVAELARARRAGRPMIERLGGTA